LLAREQVATPARLEAAALKLGLRPVSALQVAAAARMHNQSPEPVEDVVERKKADTLQEQNGHAQIVRSGQPRERSATRR
jgi:hypothetical protein